MVLAWSSQLLAAAFAPDGTIEGDAGRLQNRRGQGMILFNNDEGNRFDFFVACAHATRPWFCGAHLEDRQYRVDVANQTVSFCGLVPALGDDPACRMNLDLSIVDNRARITLAFDAKGDAKALYRGILASDLPVPVGRSAILVDGVPLVFDTGKEEPRSVTVYEGFPKEMVYIFEGGRKLRLFPVSAGGFYAKKIYRKDDNSYVAQIGFKLGDGNRTVVDVDLGSDNAISGDNVYEGINFSTNRFRVPDYSRSRNLVQNPGFEDGLDYWTPYSLGQMTTPAIPEHFLVDESGAFEGNRCLKILLEKGQTPAPPATFAIPLRPGTQYAFSFYAKADRPDAAKVSVAATTDTWGNFLGSGSFPVSTEWTRQWFTFTPQNKAATFSLQAVGDGVVWLDGIQLEKGTEPTEFIRDPVGVTLVTDHRDNLFQPGEDPNARLRIQTLTHSSQGEIRLQVRDFYGKVEKDISIPFKTGEDGVATIELAWAARLGNGLHIFQCDVALPDGFRTAFFQRLTVMPFLANDFKHKNIFSASTWYNGRMDAWERRIVQWKKAGYGSVVHFDPPPKTFAELLATHKILGYTAIFDGGDAALDRTVTLARKPEKSSKLRWLTDLSDADFQAIEEEAFTKAKAHPETFYWKTINEPGDTETEDEIRLTVRAVAAARRGVQRANPNARIMTPDPANMSPSRGIRWLEMFLANGGAEVCDIVAVHPYRQHPEDPDLDLDIQAMIHVTDKYKPGAEIWFTEGMYYVNHHLPALWLDALDSPCGGDHSRLRAFSYDLGLGERMCAANAMRYWLACLKHADRVKASVEWCVIAERLTLDLNLTPQALVFASNTLGNLLGNARFVADADFAENVRAYIFEDEKGCPVAAVWHAGLNVAKGTASAPRLHLRDLAARCEILGLTNAPIEPAPDGTVEIGPFPLFLRGRPGTTAAFTETFAKLPLSGENVRQSNVLARFATPESVELSIRNSLARPIEGTLSVTRNNELIEDGPVKLEPKAINSRLISIPPAREGLQAVSFGATFTPVDTGMSQKTEVSFEYFTSPRLPVGFKVSAESAVTGVGAALPLDRFMEWDQFGPDAVRGAPRPPYGGSSDLSANLRTAWDEDCFIVALSVRDNKIVVADAPDKAWQGDSVQIYFDSWGDARNKPLRGFDHNDQTYDVWFDGTSEKAVVFRRVTPEWQLAFSKPGVVPGIEARFAKTPEGYDLVVIFPKKEIAPLSLEAGASFGFAVLVNDHDGDFRKRGLTLTPPGTEPNLSPHLYPIVILGSEITSAKKTN
jgi:hypothetical protein